MKIASEIPQIGLNRSANRHVHSNNSDFGHLLKSALTSVNNQLNEAEAASFMLANGEMDIHNAVIIAEKANLALQLTVTIRNKVIEAYQEIMRMQV